MRDWNLGPGDPLFLTIAADFRLCTPDYFNDHAWELEIGGGEPSALVLRTTYGLRARSMRIFPRFSHEGLTVTDPNEFSRPPRLHRFYPNFLLLGFSPIPGLEVVAEYWIPDPHTCAGRFSLTNPSEKLLSVGLELCGQLVPLDEGNPFSLIPLQLANILAGRTSDLCPVLFMTGGPLPGVGPYPSLHLDLTLQPGETRTLTWCQAALGSQQESLDLARLTAARPWEVERTRLEMVNTADSVEIYTGDAGWDAALALSQKAAVGLFFGASSHLPFPSYVSSRGPDNGYSRNGQGTDHPASWSGQTPLECWYLAGLLPALPQLTAGLVSNFLSNQSAEGFVSWKTGLAGQRGRWLAAPILATLAWQAYQSTHDIEFLRKVEAPLKAFLEAWLAPAQDKDGDGFPEWHHPLQTGFEDNPAFTLWQAGGQGLDITTVESPALAALLYRDIDSLGQIAAALGRGDEQELLRSRLAGLRAQVETCWDLKTKIYRNRDRDSHFSPAGKNLGSWRGNGILALNLPFHRPLRLFVRLNLKNETTMRPEVVLRGHDGEKELEERFERMDFKWGIGFAVATSRNVFTSLEQVEISGVDQRDRLNICAADFSAQEISLLLPLWAGIPDAERADEIVHQTIFNTERFGKPYGIPACPFPVRIPGLPATTHQPAEGLDSINQAVHLPLNSLLGAGMVQYGYRAEAAQLCTRLMGGVIRNLRQQHFFSSAYHAVTGAGIGDRNPLQGLAPGGLFLEVLGLRIDSPNRLILSGKNPFPWPVTVQYRGLRVTRQMEQTLISFPDGRSVTLHDPTDAVIATD